MEVKQRLSQLGFLQNVDFSFARTSCVENDAT